MPNPQPGALLGAYQIESVLGAGSMGEVFRGIDTGLNRRVAIKILSQKHKDSPELRARFVREGRAVAAISHPNVVQVFATGSFDDRPYIAMELLDGTDLGTTVEQSGPLDSLSAALAILDAAQGLAAAAKAGLIHRDVKPSNLVRLEDGQVKVTDFGLAKPVEPGAEPALTAMGVVVGTPDYIAPEQARGEQINERVDIYALGGTLYYLLTGIPPFRTGTPSEDKYLKVVARHLRNPAPDATVKNPAVDRELAQLALAMMAKKPEARPTYDELCARLAAVITRLDPDAVPIVLPATRDRSRPFVVPTSREVLAPAESAAVSESELAAIGARRLPAWLVLVTLASLALFGTGLVVYLRSDALATPGPAPSADAGVVGVTALDAAPARALEPPEGMLLVTREDGTPWIFVDAQPITLDAYRKVFARHAQQGAGDDPVTGLSYTEAKSYALTDGARLLTSEEWDAAARTPGFVASAKLLEWVDSPDGKAPTVRTHGATQTRPDRPHEDVTFRTAVEP